MNIELTPEQVKFVERAIASGQYSSVEEVLAQIVAIGIKEVEKQILLETDLERLRWRELDRTQLGLTAMLGTIPQPVKELPQKLDLSTACWSISGEAVTDEQRKFLEQLNDSKRRSEHLWDLL